MPIATIGIIVYICRLFDIEIVRYSKDIKTSATLSQV